MPISHAILSDRDLALVVYEGTVSASDRAEVIEAVRRNRSFRPDQMHLVDLSGVTGWDLDLEAAVRPGALARDGAAPLRQSLCVYYAPTPVAQRLAAILARAWTGNPNVVPVIVEDEAEALAILGQTEMRVAELATAA